MRRLALLVVFAVVGACASFASSNDGTSDVDAGNDASTEAASDSAPGPPPGADAGDAPNLLFNGDFELGCTGWTAINAQASESNTARSGTKSCRVCAMIPDAGAFLHQNVSVVLAPGARYVAEAYVRAPDGDAATSGPIEMDITEPLTSIGNESPPLDDTWQQVAVAAIIGPDGGMQLQTRLAAYASNGGCWLVDDARLYRAQ